MKHTFTTTRMMPLFFSAAILMAGLLAAGCRDDSVGNRYDDEHGVQVNASATGLVLRNSTPETVYFMAVERETATRIDWLPGFNAANSAPYGKAIAVPYDKIAGYKPQCEVIVYLWNGRDDPSTHAMRVESMRSLIVKTP
ncbi:MAG: hypothetical protein ACM3Q4_00065 [Acidobacteriota bacterium]